MLDFGTAAQTGSVVDAEAVAAPIEVDRNGVAGDARLRPGEQALLADEPIDQSGLTGVGPSDDSDADRTAGVGRGVCVVLIRFRGLLGQRRAQRIVEIG